MAITCCKDCIKRYLGCHDICETYKTEKEMFKKEKEYHKQKLSRVISNGDFVGHERHRYEYRKKSY